MWYGLTLSFEEQEWFTQCSLGFFSRIRAMEEDLAREGKGRVGKL